MRLAQGISALIIGSPTLVSAAQYHLLNTKQVIILAAALLWLALLLWLD